MKIKIKSEVIFGPLSSLKISVAVVFVLVVIAIGAFCARRNFWEIRTVAASFSVFSGLKKDKQLDTILVKLPYILFRSI